MIGNYSQIANGMLLASFYACIMWQDVDKMLTWTGDTHMQSILQGIQMKQIPLWSYQRNRWFKCFFFSLHLQNTKYKICVPQITPDLLYITKHLFPHQTENFVHFEMLFYQWFFTCICVFIISHSHSAISNPILFICYLFIWWTKQINNIVSRVTSDIN